MPAARIFVSAAAFALTITGALAQGTPAASPTTPADPAQSAVVDAAYTTKCEAKVSKPLCACVVAVAHIQVNDLAERQVFFDYMMGEVEKAKAQRAMFPPEKARLFNVALQKADGLLGEQCEKFKDAPKAP